MRRKQTTLIVTSIMIFSLLTMSQLPAIQSVENVHPEDANQGPPPVTDTDRDGIPDVWEQQFGNSWDAISIDGRSKFIQGMDYTNGSDGIYDPDGSSGLNLDMDNDGLQNVEEYCWPYLVVDCFTNRTGLTGEDPLDPEGGFRLYLDPTRSDTDGDGMPDGYEIQMCMSNAGGLIEGRWSCPLFDPLNGSDGGEDYDEDGFDIDRDGSIEPNEYYNNSAEYNFGVPLEWMTEIDGLWFGYREGDVDERYTSRWRGTDPLNPDSDFFRWSEIGGLEYSPGGDEIPDGWEVYFGLDPHNKKDNLEDTDSDGWDLTNNGEVTRDLTTDIVNNCFAGGLIECGGEAFSNLEEYLVSEDSGDSIRGGLKTVEAGSLKDTLTLYDKTTDVKISSHDVKRLATFEDSESSLVYVGTKVGLSVFNMDEMIVEDLLLPNGVEMNDMVLIQNEFGRGAVVMATTDGVYSMPLDKGGVLNGQVEFLDIGPMEVVTTLVETGGNQRIISIGQDSGYVFEIKNSGELKESSEESLDVGLFDELNFVSANPTSVVHVSVNGEPTLFLGTDKGLIKSETPDAKGVLNLEWVFDQYNNNNLRNLTYEHELNLFEVRTIVPDAAISSEISHLWIGTGSGIHLLTLSSNQLSHSGSLEHTTSEEMNDVYSILPLDNYVMVGSKGGTWKLVGGALASFNQGVQESITGRVVSLAEVDLNGTSYLLGAVDPGRFSNIALIDPGNNDSDFDGIPDGWEYAYALDPTDPTDALLDPDADGLNLDGEQNSYFEQDWNNLDEFRYQPTTDSGYPSTDPRDPDTDGDGINDGMEFFGFYYGLTEFDCHYVVEHEYVCDENNGASDTYLLSGGSDSPLDATNNDTDGDGMPDGWEIENRRWVGTTYTGGNNWSLDPLRADDALWDADGDGLSNICEFAWGQIYLEALSGNLFESMGESIEAVESEWSTLDPNNIDSDGDTLPDGWEALANNPNDPDGNSCYWTSDVKGINPLNGSDATNNPDGDGFDVNNNGILEPDEEFNNYLEYHIRDTSFIGQNDSETSTLPFGIFTQLWQNTEDAAEPVFTFGELTSPLLFNSQNEQDKGSANPISPDSDGDGMPDGWEIWYARWDVVANDWTLNPLSEEDKYGDPDSDGYSNWEEYNSINPELNEIHLQFSPKYYIKQSNTISGFDTQVWGRITTNLSFGSFIDSNLSESSGMTCDPNNPDTDGDGMLDGLEMLLTDWNSNDGLWTLNPLVAGDGDYDADNDGLTDRQELSLVNGLPDNGVFHPPDAPVFYLDAEEQMPGTEFSRVGNILNNTENRATLVKLDLIDWQIGNPPTLIIETLRSITDPTHNDTDRDEMLDGYEYWFTEWDLEENRWSMNPLISNDIYLDLDDDSYDCDGDGEIAVYEVYSNLREWQARTYGKEAERYNVPLELGFYDYATDAIKALSEEEGLNDEQANERLYDLFSGKLHDGFPVTQNRLEKINELNENNFNNSLIGISDPTHPDSDSDGMPDGWEFCYSTYISEPIPVSRDDNIFTVQGRWGLNPLNPLDGDYDIDNDGWYDRSVVDTPAKQGKWNNHIFTISGGQYGLDNIAIPFTNYMEFDNGTYPHLNDTDDDSQSRIREGTEEFTLNYYRDYSLSDGREILKYGTNPLDNDTDWDMLPDWYEYAMAWNESLDNFSSQRYISVEWVDVGAEDSIQKKPLKIDGMNIMRPDLSLAWFTLDPRDPTDALLDPDNDGDWDCSGVVCEYDEYSNFQEFYAITDDTYRSATLVRSLDLQWDGVQITEWWQFRKWLLHLGEADEMEKNYLKMYKRDSQDEMYAKIIQDNDNDFFVMDSADDESICRGDWTDSYGLVSSTTVLPDIGRGQYPFGWWILDIDGDFTAEGTDPTNWDTDGDWMVDWYEVHNDENDGVRGDISAIRYDDRTL